MKKLIITIVASFWIFTSLQASTPREFIIEGNTLWSQGKFTEAETEFKKALEINPESSTAHARLANLYLTQNKTPEAVKEFQNAINDDPENAKLFIGLAIAYLHQQYYQMAETMVIQAIEIDPEMANAKKLKDYIDAKKERISQQQSASAPAALQGHMKAQSAHGKTENSIPAAVQKSLQK